MPCRSDYDDEADRRAIRTELDTVTAHLCIVLHQLESAGLLKDYGSLEIHAWFERHKEADRRMSRMLEFESEPTYRSRSRVCRID